MFLVLFHFLCHDVLAIFHLASATASLDLMALNKLYHVVLYYIGIVYHHNVITSVTAGDAPCGLWGLCK